MKILIIVAPSNHHFIHYKVFMRLKATESSSHNTTGSSDMLGGRTDVLGSRLRPNGDFHTIKARPHDRHGSTFLNHRDGWWGYYLWNRFGKTAFRFIYKTLPTTLTPPSWEGLQSVPIGVRISWDLLLERNVLYFSYGKRFLELISQLEQIGSV